MLIDHWIWILADRVLHYRTAPLSRRLPFRYVMRSEECRLHMRMFDARSSESAVVSDCSLVKRTSAHSHTVSHESSITEITSSNQQYIRSHVCKHASADSGDYDERERTIIINVFVICPLRRVSCGPDHAFAPTLARSHCSQAVVAVKSVISR